MQALKSYEPDLSGYDKKINWNFEKYILNAKGKLRRTCACEHVITPHLSKDLSRFVRNELL